MRGIIETNSILDKIVGAILKDLEKTDRANIFATLEGGKLSKTKKGFLTSIKNAKELGNLALIAELKPGSPSKGSFIDMHKELPRLLSEYEKGGASAISVITERNFFGGNLEFFFESAKRTELPLLRKDFIVDRVQLAEARILGASAALLIVAMLDDSLLNDLYFYGSSIGLDILVEVHDESELSRVIKLEPKLIGINNRNLNDFSVSLECFERLSPLVPDGVLKIAESGINTALDSRRMKNAGAAGVLVGEGLVRSSAPDQLIKKLLAVGA